MRNKSLQITLVLLCLTAMLAGCTRGGVVDTEDTTPELPQEELAQSAPFHVSDIQGPVMDVVDIASVMGNVVSDRYLRLTEVQTLSSRDEEYQDELVIPLNGVLDNYIVGIPVWVGGDLMDIIVWKLWNGGIKVAAVDYYSAAYTNYVGSFPQYFVRDVGDNSLTLESSRGDTVSWLSTEYYDNARCEFTDLISLSSPFGIDDIRTVQIDDCYYKVASDIEVSSVYAPLLDSSIVGFLDSAYAIPVAFDDYDVALCIPADILAVKHVQTLSTSSYQMSSISSCSMPAAEPEVKEYSGIRSMTEMSSVNANAWSGIQTYSYEAPEETEEWVVPRSISGR